MAPREEERLRGSNATAQYFQTPATQRVLNGNVGYQTAQRQPTANEIARERRLDENYARIEQTRRNQGNAAALGLTTRYALQEGMFDAGNQIKRGWNAATAPIAGFLTGAFSSAPEDEGTSRSVNPSQSPPAPVVSAEEMNRQAETNQQTPANTTTRRTVGGVEADVTSDANGRVTQVQYGSPNTPGYGMIRLTGTPNRQQAQRPQPGLGYNQDSAQQAVNQYGGIGSVRQVQGRPDLFAVRGNAGGYGFQGSARDAALFGAPVFNSAHRVQDGPNETFLRYRAEERARRAAPQPVEQGPMGWKRLKAKADNESRERIADMTTRMGYSTDAARNALTQQQLAQQYALGLGQAGNDALRTQAALGLNSVQMQQAMQQMRQQQMLDNARQTYATARPGSQEWIRARRFIEASNDGKENERKPERAMMELPDGTKAPIQYNDDGTYTRMTEAQTGVDNRDYSLSDKEKKAISKNIPDNMKAAFERDPEGFMRHYAAIMGL